MNKNKIAWCFRQKRGMELVEPNDTVARAYILDAEESLATMQKVSGK